MKEIKLDKQYTRTVINTDEYNEQYMGTSTLFEQLSDLITNGDVAEFDEESQQFAIRILAHQITNTINDEGVLQFGYNDSDYIIELTPAEEW
jgi:hypothetical protein